ncbi:hypothetical protein EHI42_01890 [Rhizobium hidalgonense]|nr:hypothetical protein EHI42_01890 [Rhizobium hidalgonense]
MSRKSVQRFCDNDMRKNKDPKHVAQKCAAVLRHDMLMSHESSLARRALASEFIFDPRRERGVTRREMKSAKETGTNFHSSPFSSHQQTGEIDHGLESCRRKLEAGEGQDQRTVGQTHG